MNSRRPRILHLTHRVPHPPNRGDRIRSWHTLRTLSDRCDVWLGCLADEPVEEQSWAALEGVTTTFHVEPLPRFRRWVRGALSLATGRTATEGLFASQRLRRVVRGWGGEVDFDAVLVFCSSMFAYADAPELRAVPRIVDLVDVDSEKWRQLATTTRGPKSWLYAREASRLRRYEIEIGRRARAVTLVSEAEADTYRRFAPAANVHGVPNGVDTVCFRPEDSPPEADRRDCVFLGVLDYRPNVDGVLWFANEVWPEVLRRHPRSRFVVVGRRPVESIRPYLHGAACAVAPLHLARGVQNKVLEAMACGRPVVASPEALTGLGVRPDVDVLRGATTDEWIGAVSRVLSDDSERFRLGAAARAFVETHHDWTTCLEPLCRLLGIGDANTPAVPNVASSPIEMVSN